jgi:poly(hydroxyalkanoate) depolymerase family esterase
MTSSILLKRQPKGLYSPLDYNEKLYLSIRKPAVELLRNHLGRANSCAVQQPACVRGVSIVCNDADEECDLRNLSDTISRLAGNRDLMRAGRAAGSPVKDRLADVAQFGSNPGALRARAFVPPKIEAQAALVVVLHGCTQTAAAYDHGTGWSHLAEQHGFAVLYPEQRRENNANLCFNWFQPGDTARGSGEAHSIRQMIDALAAAHDIDTGRIFITGLSAGGAMAASMLATHPEVFAGGAIIAGLPHGVASTVPEAFDRMRGHGVPDAGQLQRIAGNASNHAGPWPAISVWHGEADRTVTPLNAEAILNQWTAVHGVDDALPLIDLADGYRRRRWRDRNGKTVLEHYSIARMGHGTPVDPRTGIGHPGPFVLDTGISSTHHIAHSWGLIPREALQMRHTQTIETQTQENRLREISGRPHGVAQMESTHDTRAGGIKKVIEDALRSAGLMR